MAKPPLALLASGNASIALLPASASPANAGDVGDPAEPSNADLEGAGFDASAFVTPESRASAVKAYNDTRVAIAQAEQGKTLDAISSGVGVAVVGLSFVPGWGTAAGAILGVFWSGSLLALKAMRKIFGTAHGGPGAWTEWAGTAPPIDENDPNWWHPDTGYAMALAKYGVGSRTPYTVGELGPWPREPQAHGFGPVEDRIARVDSRARAFARFAMPLLYRAYELTMNARNWTKIGGVDYANTPDDLGKMESGVTIANPFDTVLRLWNSQRNGPSVEVSGGVFPLAPISFALNVGPMKAGPRQIGRLGRLGLGQIGPATVTRFQRSTSSDVGVSAAPSSGVGVAEIAALGAGALLTWWMLRKKTPMNWRRLFTKL